MIYVAEESGMAVLIYLFDMHTDQITRRRISLIELCVVDWDDPHGDVPARQLKSDPELVIGICEIMLSDANGGEDERESDLADIMCLADQRR